MNRSLRAGLAGFAAALLACQLLTTQPAAGVTTTAKTIQGSATGTQQKEWFNKAFDTGERFFGNLRGRISFGTDTTASLTTTRTISSDEAGALDAGSAITTTLNNSSNAARLQVTGRPRMRLIFEWQPQGESYVCDNNTFPTLAEGIWFMRTDGGGRIADGVCGAIDVTADDLDRILQEYGIDLELPEVFALVDQFFNPGFSGTQNISESHPLLDIKVCKILTDTFGLPIGDHCDIEMNALVTAPLTTLGHTLNAQLCMDGQLPDGTPKDCLVPLGDPQSVTFTDASATFAVTAPCPPDVKDVDVRITSPAWSARLENVNLAMTADFNIHLTAEGDGVDVTTLALPGSIALLTGPMPLNVTYPNAASFVLHVGELTPDDDAPAASIDPALVTIDEGSSTTFIPVLADLCSATADLTAAWAIDGQNLSGPTLTRAYDNDWPNALHSGTLVVSDQAGNQSPAVPFSVTVRNVAPLVQLSGLPSNPIPRGTSINLTAQVSDPGADLQRWTWSYGDGTSQGRTATSPADRTDSGSHAYAVEGLYTLQVGVYDGTDLTSTGGVVTVYDPLDRLVGSGTFKADTSSLNVPVGSKYSAQASVAYANGGVRPSGSFVADFQASIGGQTVPKHLVATSFDWIFESGLVSRTQGSAALSGQSGWQFQAEVTRSKVGAQTARVTVTLWRPGLTTLANPDYRFSGPRATGNIQ